MGCPPGKYLLIVDIKSWNLSLGKSGFSRPRKYSFKTPATELISRSFWSSTRGSSPVWIQWFRLVRKENLFPTLEDTLFSDGIRGDLVSLDRRRRGWGKPENLSSSVSACFEFIIRKHSNPQKRDRHPNMHIYNLLLMPLLSFLFIIYIMAQRFENFWHHNTFLLRIRIFSANKDNFI